MSATPTGYPPEPWQLHGTMIASTFHVPSAQVPIVAPPGWSPVRLARRCVVTAAWVDYTPPGVLTYRELMVTLLVRRGRAVAPTILSIWVDSAASREGGRALWAIPKEQATFDFSGSHLAVTALDGAPLAVSRACRRHGLPGVLPLRFSVVQERGGVSVVTPVRVRGRLATSRVTWDAPPGGPLGWLAGRRPVASVQLSGFSMSFGSPR